MESRAWRKFGFIGINPVRATKATHAPGEPIVIRATLVVSHLEPPGANQLSVAKLYYQREMWPLFQQVTDAFQLLGLPPALVFSDDALRDSFREAGKLAHPDAGGGDGEFAALREAFSLISSPSRRLLHWLELRGTPGEVRGTIGHELMDLFSEVGAVTQQAETVIRKRDEAKSVLVRAMLEGETQLCRESVERAISKVETMIHRECSSFPDFENAADLDLAAASKVARNLAFLEKWRAGLRSCFSRLV